MAIRAGMAALIARVRGLIHDPAGAGQVFDDQAIQDALDARRSDVRRLELTTAETIFPGGASETRDYYAERGPWEDDVLLQGSDYATLTPETPDLMMGHWAFAKDTPPPVYLTGKTYDVYAAAADLLEAWAAKQKLAFDFSADGAKFHRSQAVGALTELAARYRRQQRPRMGRQIRGDVT